VLAAERLLKRPNVGTLPPLSLAGRLSYPTNVHSHRRRCNQRRLSTRRLRARRHPLRCNVNDAPYIRRCWCSSDAQHTRGYAGTLGPNCLERCRLLRFLRRVGWRALTNGRQ
jgi:hypothetical protein